MRRSKLESYEAILEVLAKEPATVDKIAYKANMNCTVLEKYLNFLMDNGLVEERPYGKKMLYAITERGMAVFKTLNFQKYLEKVTASLKALDDALLAVPLISKGINEREKKSE